MSWGEFAQLITAAVVAVGYIRGELRGLRITAKVDGVQANVEKVAKATDGMKDELVQEVRKASFAAGAKSETDKK